MRPITPAVLIRLAAVVGLASACAPREAARTDSVDSAAAAEASPAAPATTAAESVAVSSGATVAPTPATKSTSTRTAPEDSGRIIGRDSARTIDPRDPKRRLPVVPPTNQR